MQNFDPFSKIEDM
jgi:hypothetical protein